MKKVCVVQSRMGNSRLPGKNGLMLQDKPQIWHVLRRIQKCETFSEIMLALPHESNGGIQKEAAKVLDIPVLDYKGDYRNVVHRYCLAADIMDGDIIIRIPGDNTMVDPCEVDRLVRSYDESPSRWNRLCTNLDRDVNKNGYPAGLGCEIYDVRFLQWLDKYAQGSQREHPHRWAFDNHRLDTIAAPGCINIHINPHVPHKLSVDTLEDWALTQEVYGALGEDFDTYQLAQYFKEKANGK